MVYQNKRLTLILLTTTLLLLVPLVAMQFTEEVNWNLMDFLVAGILLFGTGLLCELALRKIHDIKYRVAICLALLIFLALLWAELAVGIFGSPISGS
jgi:hypothetical protein